MKRKFVLATLALWTIAFENANADTYTVNTSSDNAVTSNCTTHTTNCSLRGAITAANASPGSTINFGIVEFCPVSGCAISLPSALPDITAPMTITGPTSHVIQRGSSASTNFRIFNVTTSGTVNFTSLTIAKGTLANVNGAGIQNVNGGTVNVTNCIVRDNTVGFNGSGFGAGISNSSTGTVNVSNSTLTGNSNFIGDGGGIFNNGSGTLNVTNSTFTTNRAQSGAGIEAGGTVTVTGCTFSGNTAVGGAGQQNGDSGFEGRGGAIATFGTSFDISNSTFVGNSATGGAGFNGNGAAGRGGAIFNGSSNLRLASCTIVGNTTAGGSGTTTGQSVGGGIENVAAANAATLRSNIIALNTANINPDVRGAFTSGGFNLIGKADGSTGFTAATDQTGTIAAPLDPKLDPNGLQNNGGPTNTIALALGSPAIDKGTSAGLTVNLITDQRGTGFPRVFDDSVIGNAAGGDGADIGAFELQTGQPTAFANISTRLAVQTGDNVLIGGFIISGTQPKKVMLRAIGPSLNLPGQLANPTLELFQGNTLLGSNDDWQIQPAADKQAVIDSGIAPAQDAESALVRTLAANNTGYTAIVRGANNATGIGVVEAYDLDRLVDSTLANISTRGFIQTGDNVLFAGTIILGQDPQKVLIRALGPSLSVPGKLADPTLELHDSNGATLESNDNWVDSPNKQAISDTMIPPSDPKESAILRVLPANGASYTAIVRGVNDTSGIGVVEVYALQ